VSTKCNQSFWLCCSTTDSRPEPIPFYYLQYAATPPENFTSIAKRTLFLAGNELTVYGDWVKIQPELKKNRCLILSSRMVANIFGTPLMGEPAHNLEDN
jgi:hypothetical protein